MRRNRWILVLAISLPLTAVASLWAAWGDEHPSLTFVVFAVTVGPMIIGGVWSLVPDPDDPNRPAHKEDTVEHHWLVRATSGAFVDLATAMALALGVKYVLGAPDLPLQVYLGFGMLDATARYVAFSRREA